MLDTPVGVSQGYHKTECAFVDSAPILFPYPWEGGGHPRTSRFSRPASPDTLVLLTHPPGREVIAGGRPEILADESD